MIWGYVVLLGTLQSVWQPIISRQFPNKAKLFSPVLFLCETAVNMCDFFPFDKHIILEIRKILKKKPQPNLDDTSSEYVLLVLRNYQLHIQPLIHRCKKSV